MKSGSAYREILAEIACSRRDYEKVLTCPLCDNNSFGLRFQPDVCHCNTCGALFRNPRPTQAAIIRSYNAGATYSRWQNELHTRDLLWRKRLNLLKKRKRSGNLLDIGTGDGFFLSYAKESFEVHSTELSECGAIYARQRGFDPVIGDFLHLQMEDASYDVITLWHVLEHLPAPGLVLQEIRRVLKPDGIVAIAVPNERYNLFMNPLKPNPFGLLTWGGELHLMHFLPNTLRRYLTANHFKILEFGVDDVHVNRPLSTRLCFHANRFLNRLTGWHFDKAMYFIVALA